MVEHMAVRLIEFVDLEKKMAASSKSVFDLLAPALGKAYVVAVTRDGCPACKRQKPKFDKLAHKTASRHGDRAVFIRIHVKQPQGDVSESLRAKDVLRHYFYPTNMILIRTRDRGAVELYRNTSPKMSELESALESAVKIAASLAKDKN
jgi:thiol-disulfide isomerase/thioredoxin